ncbi:MAG: diadenylate cyclase CdaA [Victivallales bacterium]|nr:diadenylate cyclase CdaA [Victivallales bacterium]
MLELFINLLEFIYYSLSPILEVLILSVIFYYILKYLRGTKGSSVLAGLVFVIMGLTIAADLLKFEVISWLLNGLWTLFAMAVIVIFQPEIRRAFAQLGSNPFNKSQRKTETINEIITAVINLAGRQHGALIVIEQNIGLRHIIDSAVKLDAKLSHKLIEAIFYPNAALHDGGIIIKSGRIIAAHCIFPLSTNEFRTRSMGTRHRAALGITEDTDTLALVVSEETGAISIAYKGNIKRYIRPDKLRRFLNALLVEEKGKPFKEIISDISETENVNK